MAILLKARAVLRFAIAAILVPNPFAADEQWSREFFPASGFSGQINAMVASPEGKLFYTGQYLFSEDPTSSASIVMQQGELRIAVASFNGGQVYALALDGNTLYAGGEFTSLSGYAVTNFASWDGLRWRQVGGAVSGGAVRAVSIHNGSLYIGGSFTNVGGLAVKGLARWDGNAWISPGAVHPFSNDPKPVQAFQWIGDSLFVGGCFDSIGGIAATNIAEYVSGSWRPLGNGLDQSSDWRGRGVHAMAANSAGELYVVGGFSRAGDNAASYVAKWDGSQWSALKTGIGRGSSVLVDAVYCFGNDIYVAGGFWTLEGVDYNGGLGLARWDGQNWSVPNAPLEQGATAITADAGTLYVAGPINSPVALRTLYNQTTGITRFDGSRWHTSGAAEPIVMAGTIANGKLRVASATDPENHVHNIADWDGVNWTLIGSVNGPLTRQLLHKDGITYAIGQFSSINSVFANQVAAYDGVNWHPLGAGLSFPTCIEFVGTNLFAGDATGLHLWNGSIWLDLTPPAVGSISAIASDGNILYVAVNDFPTASEIARWDGQQWSTLGFQGNGPVYTLRAADHRLYVGGGFTEVAGSPANMLAQWDGVTWRELGGGITGWDPWNASVRSIISDNEGGIFVAGYISKVGDTPANSIAHWDGEEWRPLGKGVSGAPYNLYLNGRDLYAFGEIAIAGGRPSSGIAKWHLADLELIPRAVSVDNNFTFEAGGLLGQSFILQQSSNLQQWQNVSTNTLTAKKLPLARPSNPAFQFFRLISAD